MTRSSGAGGQDQGARDLSGSGSVQPWPLRQSQRPALALRDAAGSDPVGRLRLGPARPDRARTLRALEPPTPAAAQDADRLGPAGAAADRALAAGTAGDRGGGQQLLRHRTLARGGPAPVHDLAPTAPAPPVLGGSPP